MKAFVVRHIIDSLLLAIWSNVRIETRHFQFPHVQLWIVLENAGLLALLKVGLLVTFCKILIFVILSIKSNSREEIVVVGCDVVDKILHLSIASLHIVPVNTQIVVASREK